ncbi:MAG: dephospho-CoA kinase [Gammaproteobacteria bacterium]
MTGPLVIGVTGGIGSGKSTVCTAFARFGIPTIDTDQVARDVVVPGSEGLAAVVAEFGPDVLRVDGALDRAALRRIVFADPARRARLEAILHPRIRARVRELLAGVDAPYCLLGIPLLVEGGRRQSQVDRVLVVDCAEETQLARVMSRDKLTAEEVGAIMRSQASRQERLDMADDVVVNSGDIPALDAQVAALHVRYLALAASRNSPASES